MDIQMETNAVSAHHGTTTLTPILALPWWTLNSPLLADPIRSLTNRGLLRGGDFAPPDREGFDLGRLQPQAAPVLAHSSTTLRPG